MPQLHILYSITLIWLRMGRLQHTANDAGISINNVVFLYCIEPQYWYPGSRIWFCWTCPSSRLSLLVQDISGNGLGVCCCNEWLDRLDAWMVSWIYVTLNIALTRQIPTFLVVPLMVFVKHTEHIQVNTQLISTL